MMQHIFIHINKTGGTSIEKALNLPFQHLTVKEMIEIHGQHKWDHFFKFTVVRNPWDKVVSHYFYRIMTNQTYLKINPLGFKQWVVQSYLKKDGLYYNNPKMFMPQVDWITDNNDKISMDFIARFEQLESDFQTICQKIGTTAVLPHLKATDRRHYHEYYDEYTADIVAEYFAKDIELFNYHF